MTSTFNLVRVLNPLNPIDCTRDRWVFEEGQSLAQLFPPMVSQPQSYSINGKVLEESDLATTFPVENDFVVVCPIPTGGGGGKNGGGDTTKTILRVVALIVITYFTWGAGSSTAGAAMFGAGTTAAAAANVAIAVGGALLVNAVLAPPKAEKSNDSSTYGIDGAKNTSIEGLVVPVVYGKFRIAGNVLNNYIVNAGDTQYLYMLLCAGEGPVAALTDVEVNDQPITDYKDYEVRTMLGGPDQAPIDWFATNITPHSVQQKLLSDWKTVTTNGEVDQLRFDMVAPNGFWQLRSHLTHEAVTVIIEIQIKKAGTSTWVPISQSLDVGNRAEKPQYYPGYTPNGTEYRDGDAIYALFPSANEAGDPIMVTSQVGGITYPPVYSTTGSDLRITGNSTNPYRASVQTTQLEQGIYDIRYRRVTPESAADGSDERMNILYLSDVNEISFEKVGYQHTAALGLKVKLSDQINGMPTVTYITSGKVIQIYDTVTGSWISRANANPAWVTLDILTNKRYGGGASMSRIDLVKWKAWAKYCDDKKLEFNGVFDTQSNVWDAASAVARCGHAALITVGTKFSLAIEREEEPVMQFSVANMVKGSFKEAWLPMTDRANEIQGSFSDAEDSYKPRAIKLYDKAALAAGAPQRVANVDLRGVTDLSKAYDELQLMLNLNRFIKRTVSFSAPLEAIVCTVGDVILVQHDMPQWGFAGRTESGSTSRIIHLDREVTMEFGKSYQALVHQDNAFVWSGTINAVAGNFVALNGYDGRKDCKRFLWGGQDIEVLSFATIGNLNAIEVASTTGMAAGQIAQLHDTNRLTTVNVVNPATPGGFVTTTTITLTEDLSSAPEQFTKWLFGPTGKIAKPFRVRSIGSSNDYTRDISAVEYNPSIYSVTDAVPTIDYSSLPDPRVQPVVIDGVSEIQLRTGSIYETRVTASFHSTQATYQDAEVFLSRDGGTFQSLGFYPTAVTVSGVRGEVLSFRIVARDRSGRKGTIINSSTNTYTVVGQANTFSNVQGLTSRVTAGGVEIAWGAVTDPTYAATILRVGNTVKFKGNASSWTWPYPALGDYTVEARHVDTFGNESKDAVFVLFTVNAGTVTTWASLGGIPANLASLTGTEAIRNADIVVGGVNLLTKSNDFSTFYRGSGSIIRATGLPDPTGGNSATRLALTGNTGGERYRHVTGLRVGGTYTMSVWVNREGGDNFCLSVTNAANWSGSVGAVSTATLGTWKRLVVTFTTPTGEMDLILGGHSVSNLTPQSPATVLLAFAQLEEGNTATQWGLAPEDISAIISGAQAAADAANLQLGKFADNNVLDRSEKPDVLLDWNALANDQAGILAQASAFGITTERTAYNNAITALATYLQSIGPGGTEGWYDTNTDSPIDRATFIAKWAAAYAAETTLLNKISQVASTLANWNNVDGRPKDQFNMVLTPTFDSGLGAWNASTVATVSGQAWTKALATTHRDTIEQNKMYVRAGERLFFAADINAEANTGTVSFGIELHRADGSVLEWQPAVGVAAGTPGWKRVSGYIDVRAETVYAHPWIQINTTPEQGGIAYLTNLYIGRSQPGATRNQSFKQFGDPAISPGGVQDSDEWIQTTQDGTQPIAVYKRVGGVWSAAPPAAGTFTLLTMGSPGSIVASGGAITRVGGTPGWDGNAASVYSLESFVGGCFVSWQMANIGVGADFMLGLNTDPTLDASYQSIDAAIYCTGHGESIRVYRNGNEIANTGITNYTTDSVFSITYDNQYIRFLMNGVEICGALNVGAGQKFFLDSSFYAPGGAAKNIRFGPQGSVGAQGPAGANGQNGANGANGQNGAPGARGATRIELSGNSWSDAAAVNGLAAYGYGAPVLFDTVTILNGSNFSQTRFWNGNSWVVMTARFDGSILVDGTVGARQVATDSLNATHLVKTAALITNSAQIGSLVVQSANIADLTVGSVKITGGAATASVASVVNGVSKNTTVTTSRTTSVTLGSVATAAAGDGRVTLILGSRPLAGPVEWSLYYYTSSISVTRDSSGSGGVRWRVRRNGVIVSENGFDWGPGGGTTNLFDATTVVFDQPGPGVTATYTYEAFSYSENTTNHAHGILPLNVVLQENRK